MEKDEQKTSLNPKSPREGWDEQFRMQSESKEDSLLIDDVFEDEEFEEWKSDESE